MADNKQVAQGAPFQFNATKIAMTIIVILVIVGILWYFYKQGTKKTQQNKLPPNDNAGTNESDTALSELAGELHNDMKGFAIGFAHDEAPYQKAVSLSNYDFVRLVNIYNAQYQHDDGKTFKTMLDSNWAVPYTPYATIKKAVLDKLATNNITN